MNVTGFLPVNIQLPMHIRSQLMVMHGTSMHYGHGGIKCNPNSSYTHPHANGGHMGLPQGLHHLHSKLTKFVFITTHSGTQSLLFESHDDLGLLPLYA